MKAATDKKRVALVAVALAAALVLVYVIFCGIQNKNAEKALAVQDYETAIACYRRNILNGGAYIPGVQAVQAQQYMEQERYQEAAEVYGELGWMDEQSEALKLHGNAMMAARKYSEAMDAFAAMGEAGDKYWQEAAAAHVKELLDQGNVEEADALIARITDPQLAAQVLSDWNTYEFVELNNAYHAGSYIPMEEYVHYPRMRQLMGMIQDKSFLTDWEYSAFCGRYAVDALLAKNFEAAIEFFEYCNSEYDRPYAQMIRMLLDQDFHGAMEILKGMEFGLSLSYDMDMDWPEIFSWISGVQKDENDLNSVLLFQYVYEQAHESADYTFADAMEYYSVEYSSGKADQYMGPVQKSKYSFPVEDVNALYAQCGTNPKGKVLILRSQKNYPANGQTFYGVDLDMMEDLDAKLYPSDLSEVEYIVLVEYDYNHCGSYVRTFRYGDTSTQDIFSFLRFKGRVVLKRPNGNALYTSPWATGTGEPDVWGAEVWQGSNLPDLSDYLITAVEKTY